MFLVSLFGSWGQHLHQLKVSIRNWRRRKFWFGQGLFGPSSLGSQRSPSCANINQNVSLKKETWPHIISGIKLNRLFAMALFSSLLDVEIELANCCQEG